MAQITPLQRLVFHLDEAAGAAFELRDNTEMPLNMKKLVKQLEYYVADLMEYEDNLHADND